MAKMKLSVVMGMVDKLSAPLKKSRSESDRYAKAIKKVQDAQNNNSAALGMIDTFKKQKAAMDSNALSIAANKEKLAELQAKAKSASKPSAVLTEKITKQQAKLDKLTSEQDQNVQSLKKMGSQLGKAGVKMYDLDGESKRLTKKYNAQNKEISKLTKRYSLLQRAMSPVQKLNSKMKFPKVAGAAVGKGAAMLGGISLGGLFYSVNQTADAMDKLAKKSANLNLPISELQAMQSQAEHAGVSSDSLSASMVRFTKRLGVLQQTGSGALGSYLRQSKNAVFRDLKGAEDTQQAYEMLLESFSKLKTAQEQMAFADAAFGDSGREMLIMLREGTEGLTAARKEFNALGGGVKAEDAAKAEAYNDALQKIQESFKSIKFAALAPIMEKLTQRFTEFTEKFKNAKWRTDFIDRIIKAVEGFYTGLEFLGKMLVFVSKNFAEIIAVVALFKVGLIALNAAMMANPIGLMVAGISAAVIAITYLTEKFVGLDKVMKWIGDGIGFLWDKFKRLINMLPDSLIPDGWKIETEEATSDVDKLANKIDKLKDKNVQLGVTSQETQRRTYQDYQSGSLSAPGSSGYGTYRPLTNQTMRSKSEVELRIKSEQPVAIDKAKSEKGTDLNLDVGNLGFSY